MPLQASEIELQCTERALIARVCDLPEDLEQGTPYGTANVRQVRYRGPGRLENASFTYYGGDLSSNGPVSLSCDIPAGGAATKRGYVELDSADWATIVTVGTELPRALQPESIELHHATPTTTLAPAPTAVTPDPVGDACATQASDVFRRLAAGKLTLARARTELPAKVPASALTSELEGVKSL